MASEQESAWQIFKVLERQLANDVDLHIVLGDGDSLILPCHSAASGGGNLQCESKRVERKAPNS